ncbi:cGMP-dependent protein kinase [Aureococcus anophagefferens]|nr:cGMP-dependent protein kinase [Aureococcus anophagefferens]
MGRAWAPVLGRPSEKPLAREPSRGLARGKSVVTFEVDQPALGDDGDGDEAPEAKRSLFCPRPGSSPRRRELDATSRNDLLNAFAKFSPAGVHAELTDLGGSESSFRAMSRKFMQEPSRSRPRSTRRASSPTSRASRLSTSLGIEALKRHINAIYTRAVDIIVKHGGDVFAGDAMLITWLAASDGDVALNGVVAAAANCALALQGPGSVHHVKEDGVDVHLSMHCALGAGKLTAYRLGDRDRWEQGRTRERHSQLQRLLSRPFSTRWEFIVAGEPLEQIRVAEPCASAGQTSLSPEVWRRLARNGFSGAPSDLEPSVFLLHGRLRQSMTSLMFRGKSSSDEIYESLGSAGELQRERKDSSSRRAPEDHLAEQRQVTTVFINVVGLGDAFMDGELDKVQDCFMTVQLCVRDRGGMLRQFIVDDKGVVAIAFFGVRGSSFEDNEYRAVRFTLAVVRALKRLDVDAYCGITVGKGFCGLVGAPNRCEYAVMGPTVNLAARLMAAASKKQSEPIFVDERVSRAARQSQSTRHVFTAMEPIKAKGFAEPVKVFALAESERDRGRVTASAAHEAQVPFTGREKLLASIDGIVEAAAREDESASPQPDSPGSPRSPLSPKRLLETMGQSTRKLVATTSSASAGALFPGRASSPSGSSRSLKASATPSPRTSPSLRLRSLSGPPKSDDPESVVRLVCVDGESGLGKSRLLREIAEKHGGAWDVVEASADAVTLQRPFAIWINVIRSLVYARHGGRSLRAADVVRGRPRRCRATPRKTLSLRTPLQDANPKPSPSRALSTKLREASGALAGAGDDDTHSLSRFIRERMTKSQVAPTATASPLAESIEKHVKQAEAGIEDTVLEGETLSSEMSEETLAVVKSALQKVPCFINLDDEAKFKHVASRMVRIDCAPGKTLITKGEKGSTIYVLESGAMECVVDGVKVSEVSAGDVIGERAMLTNSARTATVSAATDTVLWSLERRDARFLVKEADYVWRRVLALESLSIPTRGDSSFMMPSSMAGIITNRLDTLSLNATTVVKLASAFGPVFHEEALRTCFPGPKRSKSADAIAACVAALIQPQDPPLGNETLLKPSLPNQRRSWAVDSASPKASDAPGEDEKERDECDSENGAASSSGLYRFKNQQIAEVIYSVVLDEQKREYHRRIADDLHLLLADHYTRSKSNEDKAMAYSLVAAKGATTLGLYREAEQLYRRVASQKVARKTALSPKEIKITESARLQSYIELAELYARFEMEPRPREDAEAPPGESSIALLSHALAILGVDHEALGEDGFASLLASNDREEHLSQSEKQGSKRERNSQLQRLLSRPFSTREKKLLARALSQLGWCHVRVGTALDHQFALQLTESCFAHSIRLSKVAGDKLAAADALNGFGTFYQLCASQVGELHATLGDTIRPSPAPAGRRLARSASQGEIPPAVVAAAAKADEPPSTPRRASSLFKRLTHSAPKKGADHDDEPPPRAPGDGKKSANRYKRTNTDATPENLKPPTPPGEHRSLLRFSRLLLLSRPDLWSIAEDKLMESYDIRESSCVEGKPSLDVAQVCVTPGAYYALALHMYESELGPLHPRTAHALAGLARIARNQGTKLITDPTPTTRRAGALILDEAIDYQARAVKARSALGQRHGTYQASVAELRAMELQRDALHLTEPAPRSADSPYQPGRAQRRKSL